VVEYASERARAPDLCRGSVSGDRAKEDLLGMTVSGDSLRRNEIHESAKDPKRSDGIHSEGVLPGANALPLNESTPLVTGGILDSLAELPGGVHTR
jgi:hypothetical protein